MVVECVTVGVYALEQVQLASRPTGKGWLARLAEADPALQPGAVRVDMQVSVAPDGVGLGGPLTLGSRSHPTGRPVSVDPVEGRAGLYLVRVDGRPVAVATDADWPEGQAFPQAGREAVPEARAGFVAGTLIDTPDGPRRVETLAAGDVVTTLANGSRSLRWVGRRRVAVIELLARPGLRPVAIGAGLIGNAQALLVAPRQRILIDDWRAEVYFGEDRVLVAAQALVDDAAVRLVVPQDGISYVTLLCDRHEVVLAEGAWSECFHPGETGLAGLAAAERAEIEAIFPEAELVRRRAAFPLVRGAEARALRL